MKTYFKIILLSFILLNSVFGQTRCVPIPEGEQVFLIVDEMPVPNMDNAEFTELLNSKIDLSKYDLQPLETVFYGVTINCKGEALAFEIPREINPELDKEIIRVIKSNMTWLPGKFQEETVDVRITERFHIVEGQFKFLNEKQLKKVRKRIK